jgi:hypothetical protein
MKCANPGANTICSTVAEEPVAFSNWMAAGEPARGEGAGFPVCCQSALASICAGMSSHGRGTGAG